VRWRRNPFPAYFTRFDNAITLRGNVAVPGRYPWHEGMRVKDLIPSRESLVTEEFWKRQNALAVDPMSTTFKSRDEKRREIEPENYRNQQYGNGQPELGAA